MGLKHRKKIMNLKKIIPRAESAVERIPKESRQATRVKFQE